MTGVLGGEKPGAQAHRQTMVSKIHGGMGSFMRVFIPLLELDTLCGYPI